ncbi:hypothetical protein [Nitrosopumilus ureiphilus]|uniref:Uncharacterized protein n=1 Tax=Nitrosopumilus ureiphilus TaxID=1470067 RepID=A0A7D5M3U6_9ARCH|nr:hypothetical protein [Nitrosopumilus ureiphilus]QLH05993.1 hypothetical protein C5F50_02065 [Nitrosopumilus ureiphilus]
MNLSKKDVFISYNQADEEIGGEIGEYLENEKISEEILTLTKLNWNNADFASNQPITLQFSRQVGRILREMPSESTPKNKYMYYM